VNALAEQAFGVLLGPVQIVRDPSDLLAVVVLWPAWLLWKRVELSNTSNRMSRFYFLPLVLAAFATAATQCIQIPNIVRLVVDNNNIYALSPWEKYFTSKDGLNWERIWDDELSPNVVEQLQQDVQLPLTLCLPEDRQVCYKIAGNEQVEESLDGGKTWDVAWKIPVGRRRFMERKAGGGLFGICGKILDPGPYDMVLIGSEGSRVLFASGNEGVLIRNEDGTFSRHNVLGAEPTPYAELDPFLMIEEGLVGLMLSLFMVLISSYMGWNILLNKAKLYSGSIALSKWTIVLACGANLIIPFAGYLLLNDPFGPQYVFLVATLVSISVTALWNLILQRCFKRAKIKTIKTWLFAFVMSAMIMGISPIYSYIKSLLTGIRYWWSFFPNIVILLITMMSLTWTYFKSAFELQISRSMQRTSWKAGFLCLTGAWLPFLLWTIGWIPFYELAIVIACISVIVVLVWERNKLRAAQEIEEISNSESPSFK